MQKTALILILLMSFASLFLLSVLSNILTGYPAPVTPPTPPNDSEETDTEKETPIVMFKVSPVTPQLFWKTWGADYYSGLSWQSTTQETVVEEFPTSHDVNATQVFTVEINTTEQDILLPLASSNSTFESISLPSEIVPSLQFDSVGNVYRVLRYGQPKAVQLVCKVAWRNVEVDDNLVSLDDIPEEISDKYFQLPNLPIDVWRTAQDLENPSYSVMDQILADVQYLRTNFVYDEQRSRDLYERIVHGSDIFDYFQQKRGVCIDAATALAIILRIQNIPSRISVGYKPDRIEDGKLLYVSTRAHAVTEAYLPPCGWVQFDATPPEKESPLLEVSPFKKEATPSSKLFYKLSITNRSNQTNMFRLFASSKMKWSLEVFPRELLLEAFQTSVALLNVTIPDDAIFGEKDIVTLTVASTSHSDVAFSTIAIAQAQNVLHNPTITTLGNVQGTVVRKDSFNTNGTILTNDGAPVENMTIFVFLTKDRVTKGVVVGKGEAKQGNFQITCTAPLFVEIGDYRVIVIALGTTKYAPSQSEDRIIVRATTNLELGAEEEYLIGFGAIHGRLLWDNGTGVANADIRLNITTLDTPSQIWHSENKTLIDGCFRIEITPKNPGTYKIQSEFSGNEYILGSSEMHTVKLKLGQPKIEITGENFAVRGEVYNITGTIQYEDIGVWGEPIAIAFDNQLLATIETTNNGTYSYSFLANPKVSLGVHVITVSLKRTSLSEVYEVAMKSKTKLTATVSEVAGGTFLLFSASITDDHDQPIQGADIHVENYGLSGKTDENGTLKFLLGTVKLWPENLPLTTRFEGSEFYLPATAIENVAFEFAVALLSFIPLISPITVVAVLVYTKHLVKKQKTLKQISVVEAAKEEESVEEEITTIPQELKPIRIIFPNIEDQFPSVWGVNEKLLVQIVVDPDVLEQIGEENVAVLIDEETVASLPLSLQEPTEFSYVFSRKGKHKIRATLSKTVKGQPLTAQAEIRVVDYVEENVRLYNEFLKKLAGHGIHVRNDMTAQDVKNLISSVTNFDLNLVHEMTYCFEKAEYSNHLTTRPNYEIMYLALRGLELDVKQTE